MTTTEIALDAALESNYIVVWEYQGKAECEADFVAAYGPDGDWARFFGRSREFICVELLGSVGNAARFFTLDHWCSATAMAEFLAAHVTACAVMDRRFSGLTVWERRIGGFPTDA